MTIEHEDTSTGTPEDKVEGQMSDEGLDLMVKLMEQNSRDLAFTTNSLIEGYREDALQAQAELDAIRWKIEALMLGDYAPSQVAVLRALYPSEAVINGFRKQKAA